MDSPSTFDGRGPRVDAASEWDEEDQWHEAHAPAMVWTWTCRKALQMSQVPSYFHVGDAAEMAQTSPGA